MFYHNVCHTTGCIIAFFKRNSLQAEQIDEITRQKNYNKKRNKSALRAPHILWKCQKATGHQVFSRSSEENENE